MPGLLALVAASLFAVAATLQQKGALELGVSSDSARSLVGMVRSRWWVIGTGAQVVGCREIVGAAVIVVGLAFFAVLGDPAGGSDNAPNDQWAVALTIVVVGGEPLPAVA